MSIMGAIQSAFRKPCVDLIWFAEAILVVSAAATAN